MILKAWYNHIEGILFFYLKGDIIVDIYENLWQRILGELQQIYAPETYDDIFRNLTSIYKFFNNNVYIMVDDEYTKKRINMMYLKKINSIANKLHTDPINFLFINDQSEIVGYTPPTTNYSSLNTYASTNLNRNHTFNNFIVGSSNNFAVKVAMIVAEQPGTAHNPLYIFGDVGLGKTHLMQSIGNYVVEKDINSKVLYVSASQFVEDYYLATRNKNMINFYEKYRTVDILLLDDVQLMNRADRSQDEFFKVFDIMYNANKQIVVTSDRPAKELKDFSDRIISRFEWGLSIDIGVPDLKHRIEILKSKALSICEPSDYSKIPTECLEYIATHFTSNIREMEGALSRALTYCQISNLEYNVDNFAEALESLVSSRKVGDSMDENNYAKIQSVVSDYYSITVDELIGKNRSFKYTLPRHIAMYLIKSVYDVPYSRIGDMFGGRDHTSVISAFNKIKDQLEIDTELKKAVNDIVKKLGVE